MAHISSNNMKSGFFINSSDIDFIICHLPKNHGFRKYVEYFKDEIDNYLQNEYKNSAKIEDTWMKKIPRKYRILDKKDALILCNYLCDVNKKYRIEGIKMRCKELTSALRSSKQEMVALANYDDASSVIRFAFDKCPLDILMHELTHHFYHARHHNKTFCKILNSLFRDMYKLIKSNKK